MIRPFFGECVAAAGGYIFHHPLPRMVPLLLRKEARGGGKTAISYCFVPVGHNQRAFRSPFGNLRPPLINSIRTNRWQGAAALSAAVTTTNLQETAPNLQRHIV